MRGRISKQLESNVGTDVEQVPECPHCGKPLPLCICDSITSIENKVELPDRFDDERPFWVRWHEPFLVAVKWQRRSGSYAATVAWRILSRRFARCDANRSEKGRSWK